MSPSPQMSVTSLDINQRRQYIGHELYAALFLSQEHNEILVVPYYYVVDSGFYCEQEHPTTLSFDTPLKELGRYATQALLACDKLDKLGHQPKGSNQPAFKASKARTVKQFRNSYVAISMVTMNTSIRVQAYPVDRAYLRSGDIYVGTLLFAGEFDRVWGASIMKIFRCYHRLAPLLT